jgi:hypothetical protein
MAKKFARKNPVSLPSGAILQLATGWDFLRSGWGNGYDQDAIAAMRSAWRDPEVRRLVQERTEAAHGPSVRPFAEFLFGVDGRGSRVLTAADVRTARNRYRADREAAGVSAQAVDI